MSRRRSSLGLFGMFGRSGDLRQLDQALRVVDVHPALVPEGVKLTIVNLMKDHSPGEPPQEAYLRVAQIFGYCVVGDEAFERVNGTAALQSVEQRVEAALGDEDSEDAQMILLALHARLISAEVIEKYALSASSE